MIEKPIRQHGSRWHPETCFNRQEVVNLYLMGLSTRQVAEQLGMSHGFVGRIVQEAGVSRGRNVAAKLRQPRRPSHHWRTNRQQARRIWSEVNGPIPEGYHVHHRDGDFTNNQLKNLECISASEHMRLHHAGPEYHIPRHLRPARKAYMKAYLKEYNAPKT